MKFRFLVALDDENHEAILMLRVLWANLADDRLMVFFFLFPENRIMKC